MKLKKAHRWKSTCAIAALANPPFPPSYCRQNTPLVPLSVLPEGLLLILMSQKKAFRAVQLVYCPRFAVSGSAHNSVETAKSRIAVEV